MSPQHIPLNPKSIKTRFTYKFLRALNTLKKRRPTSSSSRDIYQRYQTVKFAADASMASAIGSRRAWSRAMLRKIRNRNALHCTRKRSTHVLQRRGLEIRNPKKENGFDEANDLRILVPGGEDMDICSLLEETAHYIKCLTAQVQVMRNIVDFYSS